jgi:hypothetical protein
MRCKNWPEVIGPAAVIGLTKHKTAQSMPIPARVTIPAIHAKQAVTLKKQGSFIINPNLYQNEKSN